MKRWKKVLLSAAVLGVAAFGFGSVGVQQAKASNLYGVCVSNSNEYLELKGGTGSFYYGVAYEIYDEQAGASSIHARLTVRIDSGLNVGDTLNLSLTNGKFNQDQTVYYALVVDNATDSATNPTPDTIKSDLEGVTSLKVNAWTAGTSGVGYRIAAITSSTISAPVASLAMRVDNSTDLVPGKFLRLVQVNQPVANVDNYTVVSLGSGIQVAPGLNATCSNYPEVDVHFTAPNDTASNKTFAIIEPKCGTINVGSDLLALGAELNTDTDFTTFLGGSHVVDTTNIETCELGCGTSSCSACNGSCPTSGGNTTAGPCPTWIVGNNLNCDAITGSVSFTLKSVAPENGITVSYGSTIGTEATCTANADNTEWTCSATGVSIATNSGCLHIKVDGTTSLNPTAWTISNLTVTPNLSSGVNRICLATSEGDAGSWYGGLEAIVPFVKSGNGYETYIKLFNRYDKDAKVFAASFKNGGSGSVMIALTQVGTIPAGGELQLTGADLAKDLNLTDDQIAYGVPIKFMIMVPSQKGCQNVSGTVNGNIDNSTWTVDATANGTACYNNANDPYVEGIVVSVTPQGQRSIPLEFKYFKNGSYVQ